MTIPIKRNSSVYVTYDFDKPVHGFPIINVTSSVASVVVDFGYTEKVIDQYSGDMFVLPTGWINPTGQLMH